MALCIISLEVIKHVYIIKNVKLFLSHSIKMSSPRKIRNPRLRKIMIETRKSRKCNRRNK